ncbi:GNAT family N-acetyltransferase [Jhaorihella thermophila]
MGNARSFALVRVIVDEAELLTIATHPDHRRRGLARAAMRDWMTRAAEMGARRAFLEVASDNLPAVALYESEGFAPAGMRRAYYRRAGAIPPMR